MNTARGADGKLYPTARDRAELARLVGIEHALACKEHLSRRQVQARLLMLHGVRRSLGAISQDLARYECPDCAVRPAERPEVFAWR